jgi:hypothetical protein
MPKLGIIAEDETDYEALRIIAQRIVEKLPTERRVGNGCSKILVKTPKWLPELRGVGCTHYAIVHDLDRDKDRNELRSEKALRTQLQSKIPKGFATLICIPIEELEAWFWADGSLLSKLAKKPTEAARRPETIPLPKEKLIQLSRAGRTKPNYTTNDNAKLAAKLDLTLARKACPSLEAFCAFVEQLA